MHDASLFVSNVQAIARAKGMKIGVIERSAGMRTGYLSRMAKGYVTPSLSHACHLADAIGENLSDLVTKDYAEAYREDLLRAKLMKKESEISDIKRELERMAARRSLSDDDVREYLRSLKAPSDTSEDKP